MLFIPAFIFLKAGWESRWVNSNWKESAGQQGKFAVSAGDFYGDAEADKGLQTTQDARFYTTSAKIQEFSNKGKDLVIQLSVKNGQKIDCGFYNYVINYFVILSSFVFRVRYCSE